MIIYQNENFGKSFEFRCRRHENYAVVPHIHQYCEILICLDGTMRILCGEKHLSVPAGHAAFILPNEIHAYTDELPSKCICAVFSCDFIPSFFREAGERIPLNPVADISDLLPLAAELPEIPAGNLTEIAGRLNLLFAKLLTSTEFSDRQSGSADIYRSAIAYISTHYREDITLHSVAAAVGYHEKYLSSSLHALTGMNFCRFLSTYRVEYAKRLLMDEEYSKRSIAEIAHEAGFSSINTFCREFRELSGVTASAYRKGIR